MLEHVLISIVRLGICAPTLQHDQFSFCGMHYVMHISVFIMKEEKDF